MEEEGAGDGGGKSERSGDWEERKGTGRKNSRSRIKTLHLYDLILS